MSSPFLDAPDLDCTGPGRKFSGSRHRSVVSRIVPLASRLDNRLHYVMTLRTLTGVILMLALLVGGCSGDKAKELLETAELEERQMNVPHAKQLYEEVIRVYPSSREAQTARERLAKLSGG